MQTIEGFAEKDAAAAEALQDIGIQAEVRTSAVYYVDGQFDVKDVQSLIPSAKSESHGGEWVIEVRYKDAVSDPAEDSIVKALQDLGKQVKRVRTAKRYYIKANLTEQQVELICKNALANVVVEDYYFAFEILQAPLPKYVEGGVRNEVNKVGLLDATDQELSDISKKGLLSLSPEEMNAIKTYFISQGRNPTDGELETIAQTWSEHCKHKTFNSEIEVDYGDKIEVIGNLFKETIVASTNKIAPKKDWLVSLFKDNAGIIKFDEKNNFAFKVETHNHPSALDPYGGAATGIGGVIRDVLGAGLGAKPIFNTDVFCFAPSTYDKELPTNMLHPKRVFKGVVSGVRDYGNRMGIPTVNGAIVYHDDYLAPLVYCGTGGMIPVGLENKKVSPDELIVVIGGKTGRDGMHGATFSSAVLDEESSIAAVQIGNPIEEKKMMDALLKCRDLGLYTCITDCGAGGFSSAIGEMAAQIGAEVNLESAPLKHAGMLPWEIWMSESQERMILSVPEDNIEQLKKVCDDENVQASVLGKFTNTKKLEVKYDDQTLVNLNMDFLHEGLPKLKRRAKIITKNLSEPHLDEKESYNEELLKILSHPTVASKEEVIRRYDFEVQGNTIGKPFAGVNNGPSDAAVVRPYFGKKALVIANGINPRFSLIDSYWMAASVIDEALRNIVATGGDLSRTALLDNFCWASTASEEKLGSLVQAAKACHDTALEFETPFISGKDSLHNEFKTKNGTIGIPDTLLISAVSVIDASDAITMDIKQAGSSIYILGTTHDELGGSFYYDLFDEIGANVPKVRAEEARSNMTNLTRAMRAGLVKSCHDCSEGGLAVAVAEMAFAGDIGIDIKPATIPNQVDKQYKLLFSESNSRFLIEVESRSEKEFENITAAVKIGRTVEEKRLTIGNLVDLPLIELENAWKGAITW